MAWAALLAGSSATLLLSNAVRQDIQQQSEQRLAFAADHIVLRIEERLNAYALLLRGAAGLFVGSDEVTREDWRSYIANLHLDTTLSGTQGIGFSRLIQPADLEAHTNAVQSEGFSEYRVYPEGNREIYTAIVFLEPFEGRNLRAFGYDMYSEPVRRAAMDRARDLNEASLSGRVELVQETDNDVQAGTLLYVPVYQSDHPLATAEQRRTAVIGWVYCPFRMSDLMTGLIGDWTRVDMNELGIRIYDGPEKTTDSLMYASAGFTEEHTPVPRVLSQILHVHGHQWLIEFEESPNIQGTDYSQVWLTLVTGLLLSLLLFSLLISIAKTRYKALKIANGLTRDIQQRETALREAHAKAEQFREALDYVTSYIYIKDSDRRYKYANKPTLELFNRSAQTLTDATDDEFFPPETCAQLKEIDSNVLAGAKTRSEVYVRHADGSRQIFLEIKTPVYDNAETHDNNDRRVITGILGISTDITSLKDHEEQMERIAHYDALTSLPNRLLLSDRLRQGLAHVHRHGGQLAVVYMDLDGFKSVNDTHGHDVGDELLRSVAIRLTEALRDGDTVARIGGDEFVAVLLDIENIDQIQPILERMMRAAADPVYVRGLSLGVSASMGVSLYPADEENASGEQTSEDMLLRQADQAMYQAKTSGKHRTHLFTVSGETIVLVTDKSL